MKSIFERFTLATRHLSRDLTYLAGISGGRDSVVLLHLLRAAGFRKVVLCHLNHGLRKTAARDQDFVVQMGRLSKTSVIIENIPKKNGGQSLESAMRTARLEFFARAAAEHQAHGVFLGHHADDLAETFLWNLLRGSGSAGLSGMQSTKEIRTEYGPIQLLRPMLEIWRSEIDAYAAEHGLAWVEDETNRSRRFTRNRLRHDILPWLEEKLQRNVRQNIHRAASILSGENDYLEGQLPEIDGSAPLAVAVLAEQPIALQRRMILRWLQAQSVGASGFDDVESIRALLDARTGPARVNLPGDLQARRRAGKISLARQKA